MKLRDFTALLEPLWHELGFDDAQPVVDPKPQGAGGGTITRFTLRYSALDQLRLLISGKTRVSVVVFTQQSNVRVFGNHISFAVLPPTSLTTEYRHITERPRLTAVRVANTQA